MSLRSRSWPLMGEQGPGFVCKECGGPSPIGVGYVGECSEAARTESENRTSCDCGYSVKT